MGRHFCAAPARARLDRGTDSRNRISLGGGTQRTRRDRGRVWYKSAPYRSRAVVDPRGVLRDFGVELPADTEFRVWDSTSEVRYLVLPARPLGTDGWTKNASHRS